MGSRRAHYVLSSHWDREWYLPLGVFQHRLVRMMDQVLDGLADGRLKGPFTTDGQAIVLEDYLQFRPERTEQVCSLLAAGKLVAGPWYVLPDEFIVSGEALVRNLELGHKLVSQMGGRPSKAGFACDLFGHTSQLPQILAGFGVRGALVFRGLGGVKQAHVRWRGPDGSELLTYVFGEWGYGDYAYNVRQAHDARIAFTLEQGRADLKRFLQEEAARTALSPVLLFDGVDHMEWDQGAYALIAERAGKTQDGFTIVHSDLDAYFAELCADEAAMARLPVVCGELRMPAEGTGAKNGRQLIAGVLSGRVWIKQENAACQDLLCHVAEPLAAMAQSFFGGTVADTTGALAMAWRYLLQNHPHDSICGCSVDQVHEDMRYRFSQCKQIGGAVANDAMQQIARGVAGEITDGQFRVTVFNTLPTDFSGVAELEIAVPSDWPTFSEWGFAGEPTPAFRIRSADGTELPYQRLSQSPTNRPILRLFPARHPQMLSATIVRVAVRVEVPATGYTTLTIERGQENVPTRYPQMPWAKRTTSAGRTIENEHLRVSAGAGGVVSILDKRSGASYDGLLAFEDGGDIGDGWFYGAPPSDEVFTSAGCSAEMAIVADGPLLSRLRVAVEMPVPGGYDKATRRRSGERVPLRIESTLTLRQGQTFVEVETVVQNTARDHRLRVLLPSGAAAAKTYCADAAFDVVERSIGLREDNHLLKEPQVEFTPQQTWTAVADASAKKGLAIVSTGLCESAVLDDSARTVALTLLRAVGQTVFTTGEPGGQMLGRHAFRFNIVPLAEGRIEAAALFGISQRLAAGLQAARTDARDITRPSDMPPVRNLPATNSWLSVCGPVVVTALRPLGDRQCELRVFNPCCEPIMAQLVFHQALPKLIAPVALAGTPAGEHLGLQNRQASFTLGPRKIHTLRLVW